MPAKVDAEQRRRELVLAAAELIAADGIAALTHQRVAERLGASTTVVTHYFRSKRELVLHTYQTMASRSRDRVEKAISDSDDPLAASLHGLLPLDAETGVEWRVWLVYQGMSIGDAELTRIWASRSATAVQRIALLIAADGRCRVDPEPEAARLFALVQGISVQSLVNPADWSGGRLRAVIDRELESLRA
jgi:AcrR family transcriptional regulator